jgi:hypothetical protein
MAFVTTTPSTPNISTTLRLSREEALILIGRLASAITAVEYYNSDYNLPSYDGITPEAGRQVVAITVTVA